MTGVDALRFLIRSWIILVAGLFVGILVAASITVSTPPTYQSTATLFVSVSPAKSVNDLNQGATFAQQTVHSYVSVIPTSYVLRPVIADLGLHEDSDTLAKKVQAAAGIDTTVVTVSVSDARSERAAQIANAIADRVVEAVPDLTPSSVDRPAVTVRIVQPAEASKVPLSPVASRNLLLGAVAGLVAGLALVVLRHRLRTRPESIAEIESDSGASVIGTFGHGVLIGPSAHEWTHGPDPRSADAARAVRAALDASFIRVPNPVFLLTSATSGESRTALAAALAGAYAETGTDALLIDADVRSPTLAAFLGLRSSRAMVDYLARERDLPQSFRTLVDGHVGVLAADEPSTVPFDAAALQRVLDDSDQGFGVVIVLAPPVLESTDAQLLAPQVAGTVLACAPGVVKRLQLRATADVLARVHSRVAGVVITNPPRSMRGGLRPGTRRARRND